MLSPMRLLPAILLPALFAACAESAKTPPAIDGGDLSRCFADAYDGPDVDRAVASCEERRFGTEWRKTPAREGTEDTTGGRLDPRLVQAGIEARMPRVRGCYRAGVKRDPSLRGEVKVRFVIDPAGHVTGAADAGSRLPDRDVVRCILGEVSSMRFPRPEDGAVTVVRPFILSPGDTQH
jgi:hypothetical protein